MNRYRWNVIGVWAGAAFLGIAAWVVVIRWAYLLWVMLCKN